MGVNEPISMATIMSREQVEFIMAVLFSKNYNYLDFIKSLSLTNAKAWTTDIQWHTIIQCNLKIYGFAIFAQSNQIQLSKYTRNAKTIVWAQKNCLLEIYLWTQFRIGILMCMPPFSWSIFLRAVIDHMICYNLNWPKIKLWVHYFVFSCALDHILKS